MADVRSNVARLSTRTRANLYVPEYPRKSNVIRTSVSKESTSNKDFVTRSSKSRVITTKGIS